MQLMRWYEMKAWTEHNKKIKSGDDSHFTFKNKMFKEIDSLAWQSDCVWHTFLHWEKRHYTAYTLSKVQLPLKASQCEASNLEENSCLESQLTSLKITKTSFLPKWYCTKLYSAP